MAYECTHRDRALAIVLDDQTEIAVGGPKELLAWAVWCRDCSEVVATAPVKQPDNAPPVEF